MRLFVFLLSFWFACAPVAAQMAMTGAGTGISGKVFTVQPLLSWPGPSASTPSTASEDYSTLVGSASGAAFYGITWASRVSVMPTNGTLANLRVSVPNANITTGSYSICIATASATCGALTCSSNLSGSAPTCSDLTHTMTVTPGELLAIAITPNSTPTSIVGPIEVSMTFTSTVGNESILLCGNMGLVAASATAINYDTCQGGTGAAVTTEYSESIHIPPNGGGTVDSLQVYLNGAPGTGAYYTINVFHNGASSSLACTVSGASATTCSVAGGTNPITVSGGDTISIATCPSENGATYAAWCAAAGTAAPTARDVGASLRYVPNSPGYSILAGTIPAVVAASTSIGYDPITGIGNNSATNVDLSLSAGNFVMSNLIVSECPGSGAAVTRTFTTYVNASLATPTATIPGGSTACPTLSTAQDVLDIITMTPNGTYSIGSALNTTTGASSSNVQKWSMLVH